MDDRLTFGDGLNTVISAHAHRAVVTPLFLIIPVVECLVIIIDREQVIIVEDKKPGMDETVAVFDHVVEFLEGFIDAVVLGNRFEHPAAAVFEEF